MPALVERTAYSVQQTFVGWLSVSAAAHTPRIRSIWEPLADSGGTGLIQAGRGNLWQGVTEQQRGARYWGCSGKCFEVKIGRWQARSFCDR